MKLGFFVAASCPYYYYHIRSHTGEASYRRGVSGETTTVSRSSHGSSEAEEQTKPTYSRSRTGADTGDSEMGVYFHKNSFLS